MHTMEHYTQGIPFAARKSRGERVCDELIYILIYKTGHVRGGVTKDLARLAGAKKIAAIGGMFRRGFQWSTVKKLLARTITEIRDQIVCRDGQPREDVDLGFFEYDIKCQLDRSLQTIRTKTIHTRRTRRAPAIRVAPILNAPRRREHRAARSTPTSTTASSGESPGPSDPDPAPIRDGHDKPPLAAFLQGNNRLLRAAWRRSTFCRSHQGKFHQETGGRS